MTTKTNIILLFLLILGIAPIFAQTSNRGINKIEYTGGNTITVYWKASNNELYTDIQFPNVDGTTKEIRVQPSENTTVLPPSAKPEPLSYKYRSTYLNTENQTVTLNWSNYQFPNVPVYLIGDATSAAWEPSKAIQLSFNPENPGVYVYEGTLIPGSFRFLSQRAWSGTQYSSKHSELPLVNSDIVWVLPSLGQNWTLTAEQAGAGCRLTLDLTKMQVKIEKVQGTPPSLQLPAFAEAMPNMPQPVYEENPLWIETWWKAWAFAFDHLFQPVAGSGFVSPIFDAAFSSNIFLWDSSFVTMFANYASPEVDAIAGLDNFYAKQYPSGEICREIVWATGIDADGFINKDNRPLYSAWGVWPGDGSAQYIGREVPSPNPKNSLDAMNHPILAWAEWESYKVTGNKDRLSLVWEPLVKYYQALQKYIRQGNGLYMTDWASMDNSPRNLWIKGGGGAIDISSEMALFARNLADIATILGKEDRKIFYTQEADDLAAIINQKMWNNSKRFYFDLNLQEMKCAIKTVAGFWPLIAQVASPQQAELLILHLEDPSTFGRKYPVPTLSADEQGYFSMGNYWSGAVWAPTNTMVIRGLEKYGYDDLAYSIAMKHIEQVAEVYKTTNGIWENYSADYISQGYWENGTPVINNYVGWSGIGPIMYLLEYAIGLKPDATTNTLTWNIRSNKNVGCNNYRFNGHKATLIAKMSDANPVIEVDADSPFQLVVNVNGRTISKNIQAGHQRFLLDGTDVSAIRSIQTGDYFRIVPSPKCVTVSMNKNYRAEKAQLFDITGKVIATIQNAEGQFILGNQLSSGVYIVKIHCQGQSFAQKVLIIK
ncbi:hypothetical protein FACS1894162_1640 [Bacteroidia bacterium]|nr:hypothetical protein FACS1894162_1640 [Bacteroidia bacterium]